MEKWVEEFDGLYPDGYPRSKYRHESCEVKDKTINSYYPYCPWCGKKITHVKVLKDDFEDYKIKHLEELGYVGIT